MDFGGNVLFRRGNPDLYGFLPGIKEGVALPQIQITFTGTKMDARYFVFHVYTMFFGGGGDICL